LGETIFTLALSAGFSADFAVAFAES